MEKNILTINCGSSSIKFALYPQNDATSALLEGEMYRIGLSGSGISSTTTDGKQESKEVPISDMPSAGELLIAYL